MNGMERLEALEHEALDSLARLMDGETLRAWESRWIGRKGELTQILGDLGKLPKEERPAVGRRGNEIKQRLTAAFEQRSQSIKAEELNRTLTAQALDVTLPGRKPTVGRLHPATQAMREIVEIFRDMGFQVYRSREVETDQLNFQLLNIPPHHPARDEWSTFYVEVDGKPPAEEGQEVLLRTHTSPGQIRAMWELHPEPIRIIVPGTVYRYEQVSARSETQFPQVEGLAVGKNITLANLKGLFVDVAARLWGPNHPLRFRASYFPFTEPSIEVDAACVNCGGKGCPVCKHTGWVEIAGAGMVHPQVLGNGGYDPTVYSGFAFGIGHQRAAMTKYGIPDIRYFWANDLRFLEQF